MAIETDQVLSITGDALEKILQLRSHEPDAEKLALRVEVTGVNGFEYAYDLAFEPLDAVRPEDMLAYHGELPVVIPSDDVDKLAGATLDLPSNPTQGGLVLRNPNSPSPLAGHGSGGELVLEGDTAEKVQQLLDQQINPAIAAHGGFAQLVAVEDDAVYLRLGGGCQGCGLAQVTLSQGIEQAILSAIPELTRVVDVTDHASGANPYFEPAAK